MLDAYLRILKDNGVTEFIGMGIAVRFSPVIQPEVTEPERETRVQRSMWEDESLWPGGKPPAFHKKA